MMNSRFFFTEKSTEKEGTKDEEPSQKFFCETIYVLFPHLKSTLPFVVFIIIVVFPVVSGG